MCFHFIRSGNKGCNKGSSCQYAHPKLCTASLTSKRCDRRNCYYYHVAGTSRPLIDISVLAHRQFNSKPSPLRRWMYLFCITPFQPCHTMFLSCLQRHKFLYPKVLYLRFQYPMFQLIFHHQMSHQFFRTAEGTENANDPITAT